MRTLHASIVGFLLASTPVLADDIPIYPVDANCREARSLYQGSQLSDARKQAFEKDCVQRQQDAYDAVKDAWANLQAKDQRT